MKDLVNRFKRYLSDTLGITVTLSKPANPEPLPFFLQDIYDMFQVRLLNEDFIVLASKNDSELTPATIHKHIDIVSQQLKMKAVFVHSNISSFNRKRLIEYKVPFVIPGNQMYLPDLGIDLRAYFIKKRSKAAIFGPSTQAVILYALTKKMTEPVTPTLLAEELGYSRMTMTRSLDEIESLELAEVSITGRKRLVSFDKNRRNLWEKALPHLRSPVKGNVWLKTMIDELPIRQAGLTALACYSILTPSKRQVYAAFAKDWKAIKRKYPHEIISYPDEAGYELEVWSYSPGLFANGKIVDPFSLYLSLRDIKDERVESAMEEMMEGIEW
ncbi:MAG: transcriptional regulator [Desulfobacteraceae bacterium]|nr:transcriptional regulator [Desulfobacteraceae bacterium]